MKSKMIVIYSRQVVLVTKVRRIAITAKRDSVQSRVKNTEKRNGLALALAHSLARFLPMGMWNEGNLLWNLQYKWRVYKQRQSDNL